MIWSVNHTRLTEYCPYIKYSPRPAASRFPSACGLVASLLRARPAPATWRFKGLCVRRVPLPLVGGAVAAPRGLWRFSVRCAARVAVGGCCPLGSGFCFGGSAPRAPSALPPPFPACWGLARLAGAARLSASLLPLRGASSAVPARAARCGLRCCARSKLHFVPAFPLFSCAACRCSCSLALRAVVNIAQNDARIRRATYLLCTTFPRKMNKI